MSGRLTHIEPLNASSFERFGRAILVDRGQAPDMHGDGWRCWYPVAVLPSDPPPLLGLVEALPHPLVLVVMERHPARAEWVFALERPIVQAVALSAGESDCPDPATVRAYLIWPGQGVIIGPGVWHAAGLAAGPTPVPYGFALARPSDPAHDVDSGWIPFDRAAIVTLEPPDLK
jgi:ureidoglycolate lyase